MNPGIEQYLW